MARKATPVAVSRRLSGKTSYQAVYSTCRAISPATCRASAVRESAGRLAAGSEPQALVLGLRAARDSGLGVRRC
jgi:hypothetical protein